MHRRFPDLGAMVPGVCGGRGAHPRRGPVRSHPAARPETAHAVSLNTWCWRNISEVLALHKTIGDDDLFGWVQDA